MKAYEILEQYEWTQGATARDENGRPEDWYSPFVKSLSATGALLMAYGMCCEDEAYLQAYHSLDAEVKRMGFANVNEWNEYYKTTKEDVIALLRKLDI